MPWMQEARRFLFSHKLLTGVRQALGVLMPALLIISTTQQYTAGLLASIGAMTAAIVDQAGVPLRQSRPMILAAIALGALSALLAGLLSSYPTVLWFAIPVLAFAVSMLTAYGLQGGLLAFVSLLLLTLSMRTPTPPLAALEHALYSVAGGLAYLLYSQLFHYFFRRREEREAIATAMFATADFLRSRARLYDVHESLESAYANVLQTQSAVVDAHQVVREFCLSPVSPHDAGLARARTQSIRLFRELVGLIDVFLDVRTDFAELHRKLPDDEILLFAHDALNKQADYLNLLAFNVARNRVTVRHSSVVAELRAMDYELEQYRKQGLAQQDPHLMLMLERLTARLKASHERIQALAPYTHESAADPQVLATAPSLTRFLDRQAWSWSLYRSNLRWSSPAFRHSVRIALAAVAAMTLGAILRPVFDSLGFKTLGDHGYWIMLTVFVVLKPGYVLTHERNSKRLIGTFLGCALAVALFHWVHHTVAYVALVMFFGVMGYALMTVNYLFAAMFITLLVLSAFHLLEPGSDAMVAARLVDTTLGCVLALLLSRILPNWESRTAPGLAAALGKANLALLDAGTALLRSTNAQAGPIDQAGTQNSVKDGNPAGDSGASGFTDTIDPGSEAALNWRVALRNMYVAFNNYSGSVYRMMREPASQQAHLAEFNRLMLENHTLALQIRHLMEQLQQDAPTPELWEQIDTLRQELADTLAGRAADAALTAAGNSVAQTTVFTESADESIAAIRHTISAIRENTQRLQA